MKRNLFCALVFLLFLLFNPFLLQAGVFNRVQEGQNSKFDFVGKYFQDEILDWHMQDHPAGSAKQFRGNLKVRDYGMEGLYLIRDSILVLQSDGQNWSLLEKNAVNQKTVVYRLSKSAQHKWEFVARTQVSGSIDKFENHKMIWIQKNAREASLFLEYQICTQNNVNLNLYNLDHVDHKDRVSRPADLGDLTCDPILSQPYFLKKREAVL